MNTVLRWSALGVSAIVAAGAAGCSQPELAGPPPPPPAPYAAPPPMGAPSGHVTTELLGGPPPAYTATSDGFISMAPIPNPEDLSPADRRRLYGAAPRPRPAPARPRVVASAPRPVAAAPGPVVQRPVAPPPVVAAPPKAVAPAPIPAKPITPAPAKPAVPAKPLTKLEQLGAALKADITQGAILNVPTDFAAGKDNFVSLSLPPNLLSRVQAEAAKLGLTAPAKTVDARATLKGDGYSIVPGGSQAARLKPDGGATFTWQVKPAAGADGVLTAEIGGELKGLSKPQPFTIGEVSKNPFPPAPPAAEPKHKFSLPGALTIPGKPTITLPVVGETKSGNFVLGVILALLALAGISVANAQATRRKAEARRRKFRTMADFSSNDETYAEPAPAHHEEVVHHAPETHHVETHTVEEPVEHHGEHHAEHHGEKEHA